MDLPSSVQETNLTVRLLTNHWLVWIFWPLRTSTNSLAVYASQPPIFLSTGICNVPSAAYCTAQQPGSIYSTCSSSSKMERTLCIYGLNHLRFEKANAWFIYTQHKFEWGTRKVEDKLVVRSIWRPESGLGPQASKKVWSSAIVFCCIAAWIQPDISGCQQNFLVVWRWNQLRTF